MFEIVAFTTEQVELIFRFFSAFARFEYALKCAGKLQSIEGEARADWKGFALANNTAFLATFPEIREACNYFEWRPPPILACKNGRLQWIDEPFRPAQCPLQRLLLAIGRVRNNLFQGGRFVTHITVDPTRDSILLVHALAILEACAHFDPEVERRLELGD
jgi:hypothetical protein